jgi:hypothetical protein
MAGGSRREATPGRESYRNGKQEEKETSLMFSIRRVVMAGAIGALAIAGQFTQAAPAAEASGAWQARHDLTSAQYQATFDQLTGQGYRLTWVSGYNEGANTKFAAVFEQGSGPAYEARHDLTSAQYQATFDQLTGQGYRLKVVSGYAVGNQARYAAIFERSSGPAFQARHGLTSAQYQATFDDLTGQGYRPVLVNGYTVGGQALFAAIFERSSGPAYEARHDLTAAQYQTTFDQLTGQGYRLKVVSGYTVGGQARYAAIFERASGAFQARHGLTSAQYQAAFDQLSGQGYKLAVVNGYNVGGQDLYAAIFQR